MATEIELKLALPRSAAPHLGRHRLLAPLPAVSHTLQNTYYDTPDFALQRRGVALRLRRRGKTWLRAASPESGILATSMTPSCVRIWKASPPALPPSSPPTSAAAPGP